MTTLGFIEALKAAKHVEDKPHLDVFIAASFEWRPMEKLLLGHLSHAGFAARITGLPFGTLQQHLRRQEFANNEIFVLTPWDLVPAFDWRTGFPALPPDYSDLVRVADAVLARLAAVPSDKLLYLDMPALPVLGDPLRLDALCRILAARVSELGGVSMAIDGFSIASFFAHGTPFEGAGWSTLCAEIAQIAQPSRFKRKKVLVTDLDNTLWGGVVAEEGIDGIHAHSDGVGAPHFVYQGFLRQLKTSGVVLVTATRNSIADARAGIESLDAIQLDDFTAVVAGYGAKSQMIRELAKQLNLGLDSFVFVDDDDLELYEVGLALPEVTCVRFDASTQGIVGVLSQLSSHFAHKDNTEEDMRRTDMYRNMLQFQATIEDSGHSVGEFLREQKMILTLSERTAKDCTRALQLINKTNQFSANGQQVTDDELLRFLDDGGRVITAQLSDKHGDHGEILALTIEPSGRVGAFVMSCRVFQRQVEFAVLDSLRRLGYQHLHVDYVPTERNQPFRRFLDDLGVGVDQAAIVDLDLKSLFADRDPADLFARVILPHRNGDGTCA